MTPWTAPEMDQIGLKDNDDSTGEEGRIRATPTGSFVISGSIIERGLEEWGKMREVLSSAVAALNESAVAGRAVVSVLATLQKEVEALKVSADKAHTQMPGWQWALKWASGEGWRVVVVAVVAGTGGVAGVELMQRLVKFLDTIGPVVVK